MQLGEDDKNAQPGIDYEHKEDKVVFPAGANEACIEIKILQHEQEEGEDVELNKMNKERDETFGVELIKIEPAGAKLSKKNLMRVTIVTDEEKKKKEEALEKLI